MLDDIEEHVYTRLPDDIQPVAQKWFYILNPRLSWVQRRKPDEVDEAFIDQFFDSREEYDAYRTEFLESKIGEICMAAESEISDEYTVFDTHRKDAMKYYALVRKFEPSAVVETGVYNGTSTAAILLALRANETGRLYSIDCSTLVRDKEISEEKQQHFRRGRPSCSESGSSMLVPGKEPGWILPDSLREYWSLREGWPQSELPSLLADIGAVDIFVHDSEHSTSCMLFEFEMAWENLAPGGLILSSHIQWNDAFETFVDEHNCDSGLTTFHYLGYEGEKIPCSTGFVHKR